MPDKKVTRRNFLKGLGAVGGAVFLPSLKGKPGEQPDNVELQNGPQDFPSVEELQAAGFTVAMSSGVILNAKNYEELRANSLNFLDAS